VVPRSPTPSEAARRAEAEAAARKQAEADALLLRLYGTVKEAERARDRRLQEIDSIIKLKRGNQQAVENQIKEIEIKAANLERAGREVPDDLQTKVERLRGSVRDLEREISQ